jgi:hypothetical protein
MKITTAIDEGNVCERELARMRDLGPELTRGQGTGELSICWSYKAYGRALSDQGNLEALS